MGPSYDLPIALGVLLASGQLVADVADALVVGELGLAGEVRHTTGVLPMAALAREQGLKRIFVSRDDGAEAALIEGIEVIPIGSLAELIGHLAGITPITPYERNGLLDWDELVVYGTDLSHIKGQEQVKRGLEVAASGGHNVLTLAPERPAGRPG